MNNVVTKVRIDGDDIFIKQGPLFGWAYAVNTDSEEAYHYLFDCDLIRLKLLESKNWPEDLPVSFKSELTYQLYKRRREEKETGGEPKTLQQFMAKCDLFKNENAILSRIAANLEPVDGRLQADMGYCTIRRNSKDQWQVIRNIPTGKETKTFTSAAEVATYIMHVWW